MSDHERLLRSFFKRWSVSFEELCASMRDTMHPNCVFKQTRFPDLRGPEETISFMKQGHDALGYCTFDVDLISVVSEGPYVASERIDYMKDAKGSVMTKFDAAAFMKIENSRIVAWRDYFDSADMPAGPRT